MSTLDSRLTALETEVENMSTSYAKLDKRVDEVEHSLDGNGGPGLLTRIALVEQTNIELRSLKRAFNGAIIAIAVGIAVEVFRLMAGK